MQSPMGSYFATDPRALPEGQWQNNYPLVIAFSNIPTSIIFRGVIRGTDPQGCANKLPSFQNFPVTGVMWLHQPAAVLSKNPKKQPQGRCEDMGLSGRFLWQVNFRRRQLFFDHGIRKLTQKKLKPVFYGTMLKKKKLTEAVLTLMNLRLTFSRNFTPKTDNVNFRIDHGSQQRTYRGPIDSLESSISKI